MRLAALVAGVGNLEVYPVFSGGTCLSKAYRLIQRFSEDLDFKFASPPDGLSRGQRRTLRDQIVAAVRSDPAFTLLDADIHPGDEARFVRCNVTYRDAPATADDLRPHLQLEVTFSAPSKPVEPRSVSSFVAQARREAPEIAAIACVSLVETAADKLSALTWRVLTRQRTAPDDDPTLIRHLHDLAALEATVIGNPAFAPLFLRTAAEDAGRGSPIEALRVLGTPNVCSDCSCSSARMRRTAVSTTVSSSACPMPASGRPHHSMRRGKASSVWLHCCTSRHEGASAPPAP